MLPPPKSLSAWTIHQEVFQNEPAFATMKRAAAFAAGKLLVRRSLIRFNAHQLVLRAAVRALERRSASNGHNVIRLEAYQSTSATSIRQMLEETSRPKNWSGPRCPDNSRTKGSPTFKKAEQTLGAAKHRYSAGPSASARPPRARSGAVDLARTALPTRVFPSFHTAPVVRCAPAMTASNDCSIQPQSSSEIVSEGKSLIV